MYRKKNKGFTLIELLAVIIILGILMIIAIPAVTTYISNSRKEAYVKSAKQIIAGARNLVNSGKLNAFDPKVAYYIPVSCIPSENGTESPYGKFEKAYVIATYTGNDYNYYWTSTDESQIGIKDIVAFDDLDIENVESSVKPDDIPDDRSVANRKYVEVFNENCTSSERRKSKEAKENLSYGADEGDYVIITPTITSYTTDSQYSGYSQTINPSLLDTWRVLRVNDDGTVELISDKVSPETIRIEKTREHYLSYVGYMNLLASKYANPEYTISTKSPGFNGQTEFITEATAQIPTQFFPSGNYPTSEPTTNNDNEAKGWGDMMHTDDINLIKSALSTLKSNGGYYIASRYKSYSTSSPAYEYWHWCARYVDSSGELYNVAIRDNCSNTCAIAPGPVSGHIRPMMTVKANLKIASGDGGKDTPYVLQ
jgi:prepilin-type N-terminal cleavage/methylation domain-containing protein